MLTLAALAAGLAGTPAPAYPLDVSGWLVVERADACVMGTDFAGPGNTSVLVHKKMTGEIILFITNKEWSAREGERYNVSYHVNGREYSDGTTIGYRSADGRGFWSSMARNFEQDFAKGKDLSIYLDGQFIRKVSLRGTSAAMAAMDRCVTGLRGKARPETQGGSGEAPRDPFARPSPKP